MAAAHHCHLFEAERGGSTEVTETSSLSYKVVSERQEYGYVVSPTQMPGSSVFGPGVESGYGFGVQLLVVGLQILVQWILQQPLGPSRSLSVIVLTQACGLQLNVCGPSSVVGFEVSGHVQELADNPSSIVPVIQFMNQVSLESLVPSIPVVTVLCKCSTLRKSYFEVWKRSFKALRKKREEEAYNSWRLIRHFFSK